MMPTVLVTRDRCASQRLSKRSIEKRVERVHNGRPISPQLPRQQAGFHERVDLALSQVDAKMT